MKKYLIWTALSAFVMLGLPWAAVTFVRGDAGMAVCLLLFFAVDPVWSAAVGAAAGTEPARLCSLPVLSAALFIAGTWLVFTMGEPAFLLYAAVYLILGLAAMAVSAAVRRGRRSQRGEEKDAEL